MSRKPTAGFRGRGAATGLAENKRIVRLATGEERMRLPIKQLEEERAMMVCREKVQQRRLPMVIVDAEYQYDRHKLTFYFEANSNRSANISLKLTSAWISG